MKIKLVVGNFINSPFHRLLHINLVLWAVSYTLVAINSGWGFFTVYRAPGFFAALIFTYIVATLLAVYVHELNNRLVKLQKKLLGRLFIYFCLGVLFPVGVELCLVQLYFISKGESIFTNTFFDIDFILIVAFILAINGFYYLAGQHHQERLKTRRTYKEKIIPALKDLTSLKIKYRQEMIRKAPAQLNNVNLKFLQILPTQIACAFKLDNIVTIIYFDQEKEMLVGSVAKVFQELDPNEYVTINQYCFYHRLLILSWTEIGHSRRLYLTLRHPFNYLQHEKQRMVSQGMSSDFKKWMKGNS